MSKIFEMKTPIIKILGLAKDVAFLAGMATLLFTIVFVDVIKQGASKRMRNT